MERSILASHIDGRRAARLVLPPSVLTIAVLGGLLFGSVDVSPVDVLAAIAQRAGIQAGPVLPAAVGNIIWEIRLPRVLAAAFVGAGLAIAGALFQAVLRNPLADPYVIGTSAGAQVGVAVATILPVRAALLGFGTVQILGFIGALLAVLVVYTLARRGGIAPVVTLILAGFVLSSFLISATTLIAVLGNRTTEILGWTLGGIDVNAWDQLAAGAVVTALGGFAAFLLAHPLDVLLLGEDQAGYLGIPVERLKLVAIALAALLTAVAVSLAGVVAFVGLVAPHTVRLLYGPGNRLVIPMAAMVGAAFLVLADLVARAAVAPTEIPLGVITPVIGAPLFLYLLRVSRRSYGM